MHIYESSSGSQAQLDKNLEVCWVAGHWFKLWLDQHLGSLNNWGESAAFVKTCAKGLDFLVFSDEDDKP